MKRELSSARRCLRAVLLASVGAMALAGATEAVAQSPTVPAHQQPSRTFAIAPKGLNAALLDFTRVSGIDLVYDGAIAANLSSPGVSGSFTPDQALGKLLAGTGLSFHFTGPSTVVLTRAQADGAMTLDPVMVEGAPLVQTAESAYGPVQGYVAKRTAVGSKTDTPIIEIPQSVSVITREQMEAQGVQTVEQALAYTPGVTTGIFGDDPRYDQFNLRGFNGNGTAVYLDGLRQWGAVYNYPQNEPYGLEKIGVIRGPASVLYGQVAPGGLVEAVSKRPSETPLHEVSVLGGSNDLIQGQFDFSGALDEGGRFLYRATGLARDAETEIEGTDNNRRFFAPAVTWRPSADTSLTFLAQYQEYESTAWPYYYAVGSDVSKIWVGDPDYNEFSLNQYHLGYQFAHKFNDMWQVRQNFRYGQVEHDSRYIMALGAAGNTLLRWGGVVHEDLESYALDNQAQADFVTGPIKHTLLFGVGYDRMHYDLEEGGDMAPSLDLSAPSYGISFSDPPISEHSRQTQQQIGVYMQDQVKIGQIALTLGGRWDRATGETEDVIADTSTDQTDHKFTGKAGVVYLFENGLAPYASYSESFLPTSGTDFYGSAFKPQTGQQKEIGVKYQPPGRDSFVGLAAYDLVLQNALTRDPAHAGRSVQTGETRSRGFEAEAKAALTDEFSLIASYTYTYAKVTESNTSSLGMAPVVTPKHMASAWGDYLFKQGALEGVGVGAGMRYIGDNFSDAANTLKNESYTLVDAMVRYDLAAVDPDLKGVQAAVNVNNLFDRDAAVCNSGGCNWVAGRTVIGKLTYRW